MMTSGHGEDHENFTHLPTCGGSPDGGNPCACRSQDRRGGGFEAKGAVPLDAEILGEGADAGIRKGDTALADKLNAALPTLAASGKLDEISTRNGLTGLIITPKE